MRCMHSSFQSTGMREPCQCIFISRYGLIFYTGQKRSFSQTKQQITPSCITRIKEVKSHAIIAPGFLNGERAQCLFGGLMSISYGPYCVTTTSEMKGNGSQQTGA